MKIFKVDGDGNCLYHAVAAYLQNDDTHEDLRHAAILELKTFPDEYSPYHNSEEETFDDYITRHSEYGVWGDNLMVRAISQSQWINIVIHSEDEDMPVISFIINDDVPTVHLKYDGVHYDLILPKNYKTELKKIRMIKEITEKKSSSAKNICKMLLKFYESDDISEDVILFYYKNYANETFKKSMEPMVKWLREAEVEDDINLSVSLQDGYIEEEMVLEVCKKTADPLPYRAGEWQGP